MDKEDFRFYLLALILLPSVVGVIGLLAGVNGKDLLGYVGSTAVAVVVLAFFVRLID